MLAMFFIMVIITGCDHDSMVMSCGDGDHDDVKPYQPYFGPALLVLSRASVVLSSAAPKLNV